MIYVIKKYIASCVCLNSIKHHYQLPKKYTSYKMRINKRRESLVLRSHFRSLLLEWHSKNVVPFWKLHDHILENSTWVFGEAAAREGTAAKRKVWRRPQKKLAWRRAVSCAGFLCGLACSRPEEQVNKRPGELRAAISFSQAAIFVKFPWYITYKNKQNMYSLTHTQYPGATTLTQENSVITITFPLLPAAQVDGR